MNIMQSDPSALLDENAPSPADRRLERDVDGRLWLIRGGERTPVRVTICFPWSQPDRFYSIRDSENREVWFVEEPDRLDAASAEALRGAVEEVHFAFSVTRILAVEPEQELRVWHVETEQGCRQFQTRLDDWPRPIPSGGWLIRDLAGDLYLVENPDALDARSRDLLAAFVD